MHGCFMVVGVWVLYGFRCVGALCYKFVSDLWWCVCALWLWVCGWFMGLKFADAL